MIDSGDMTETDMTETGADRGPSLSAVDKFQRKSFLREFIPMIVSFWIVLAIVLNTVDLNGPGAQRWILLPVIPMIGVAVAIYRAVQRSDEYGRIVMLECMALGFGAAMIVSFALGFLGIAGVAWTNGGWLVFGAGMSAWSVPLIARGIG